MLPKNEIPQVMLLALIEICVKYYLRHEKAHSRRWNKGMAILGYVEQLHEMHPGTLPDNGIQEAEKMYITVERAIARVIKAFK